MKKKILFVFGTRPEAIKMAPLVRAFAALTERFDVRVCLTGQHRQMLDQVMEFFDLKADYDLNLMLPNQTLFDITANAIKGLEPVLEDFQPDGVFVQGDTTTAFAGALAAFYKKAKVLHLEAGLRSGQKYSPFPEEINRILAGHIADFHFAPTPKAQQNLAAEGIKENVWVVGNTVIDALILGLELIKTRGEQPYQEKFSFLRPGLRTILVTGHRRESFGKPFEAICNAINSLVNEFEDVQVVYPVHLNPNVRDVVFKTLSGNDRIHLIEPLDYPYLIWLMSQSYLVLTDSGGIQEEAPSLGKPVLVMREVTERIEGIEAGTALLVGTDEQKILLEARKLLTSKEAYSQMSNATNPYGDGTTSAAIAELTWKNL